MAEPINGTGEDQPADDSIRASLAAAMADKPEPEEKPEPKKVAPEKAEAEPPVETEDKPEPEAPSETDKPAKEKAAKEPVKEPAEGEEKPEPTAEDKVAADKKTAVAALTGKWSAKDKEAFGKLPPEGQELLLRRHKEMEGAFTKKTQEIAGFRKDYEPVQTLLAPYSDQMKQHGWTPSSLISAWANVEKRLMDGDGVNVVAGLMNGYKLDIAKVAEAMGLKPAARTNGAADPATGELPPAEAAQTQLPPELTRQLQTIQQRLDADDRRRADEQRASANSAVEKVMAEIEQFKTAQDDKGSLLHPHFEEVEKMMTNLVAAAKAAGEPVPPLAQLYETAVMANTDLREQVIAARVRAQRDAEAQAARAKAEKAKRASASVTGAPGSGQAPQGRRVENMSLREQLEEAAAEADG